MHQFYQFQRVNLALPLDLAGLEPNLGAEVDPLTPPFPKVG